MPCTFAKALPSYFLEDFALRYHLFHDALPDHPIHNYNPIPTLASTLPCLPSQHYFTSSALTIT